MDLPKNITQIGQSDKDCKIYVEDYVMSYLKQWNRMASNKDIAIALYGVRKEENQVSYLFLYGACKLDFLQRETRHLSQAQQQEVDKLQRRYFQDYSFLGYRILNGEMIEGFHVGNQGSYRYIGGYAQFYEKNDSMLAYMLDTREEQAQPEVVERDKYEEVKRRQEERRAQSETHRPFGSYTDKAEEPEREPENKREKRNVQRTEKIIQMPPKSASSAGMRRLQMSVVAVFALLCLAGLSTLDGEDNDLAVAARQVIEGLTEQKLPDTEQATGLNTLITEDKLVAAVQEENQSTNPEKNGTQPSEQGEAANASQSSEAGEAQAEEYGTSQNSGEISDARNGTTNSDETSAAQGETVNSGAAVDAQGGTSNSGEASNSQGENSGNVSTSASQTSETNTVQPMVQTPVAYIIQKGDTLISICNRQYGTAGRVNEVCTLNQISNPDDIKIGQVILLP